MIHALIMAGGSGTRFWPLSRQAHPKQFLSIGGKQSLLRTTAERIVPLCGWENLLVVASSRYGRQIRSILPEMPRGNLVVEPRPRNTAPAIGLAAAHIYEKDPDAVMVVLPSDHIIRPPGRFRSLIRAACREARSGAIVTLGIIPSHPETGFGYIKAGEQLRKTGDIEVLEAMGFTEKPDLPTAMEYLQAGNYYWNSGMFIFKAETILRELQVNMPSFHRGLARAFGMKASARKQALEKLFARTKGISIDYAVMEKSTNMRVIPADLFWSDVGSWAALLEVENKNGNGSVIKGDVIDLSCQGSVIHAESRLVAAVGLKNMIVVETPDAVLVCPVDEAQGVRQVVDELKRRKRRKLL
ncbi:MAG: mannose-1-phosphate guanylyltransferase [Deltaproteobacteria bacterium]|nr:MAG: mannose-1-phosphate guanylyltransferase [Deltaproteobacteria bacterium]